MGMVTIAANNLPVASGVGTGQTSNNTETTLCRMTLTTAERAARFEAFAVSDQGEKRCVEALGFMVLPAEESDGWRIEMATAEGCSLSLTNGATLEFTVTGGAGTSNWIGMLAATFTDNYSG